MSDNTDQIQEMLRLQKEMQQQQQESFKQILALKNELLASQEKDRVQRRSVFRASIIIFVAYLIYSVAPLFFI